MISDGTANAVKHSGTKSVLLRLVPSIVLVGLVCIFAAIVAPDGDQSMVPYWLLGANLVGILCSEIGFAFRLETTLLDVVIQKRVNPYLLATMLVICIWPFGQLERMMSISLALLWTAMVAPTIVYVLVMDMAIRKSGAIDRLVLRSFAYCVVFIVGGLWLLSRWPLTESELTERYLHGKGGYQLLVDEYRSAGVSELWETRTWNWWWMPIQNTPYALGSGAADEVLMRQLDVQSIGLGLAEERLGLGESATVLEIRRFGGIETVPATFLVYSEGPFPNENLGQGRKCHEIEASWYACKD